jgi:acetyl-CoA C-acetyltransferase
MTGAVIVSTARTGSAKSWKGVFNMACDAPLGGHVLNAAIRRARAKRGEGIRLDMALKGRFENPSCRTA